MSQTTLGVDFVELLGHGKTLKPRLGTEDSLPADTGISVACMAPAGMLFGVSVVSMTPTLAENGVNVVFMTLALADDKVWWSLGHQRCLERPAMHCM